MMTAATGFFSVVADDVATRKKDEVLMDQVGILSGTALHAALLKN